MSERIDNDDVSVSEGPDDMIAMLEAMSAERFDRIVGEMGRMLRFVGDGEFREREVREFHGRVLNCPYRRAIAKIEARRADMRIVVPYGEATNNSEDREASHKPHQTRDPQERKRQ